LNAARVVMRRSLSVYDSRHAALVRAYAARATGGRYSGGLYCNSLADFANGGRVWILSRVSISRRLVLRSY
jgi:hypothetical protein